MTVKTDPHKESWYQAKIIKWLKDTYPGALRPKRNWQMFRQEALSPLQLRRMLWRSFRIWIPSRIRLAVKEVKPTPKIRKEPESNPNRDAWHREPCIPSTHISRSELGGIL